MANIPRVKTKDEIEAIQDECLELRNKNIPHTEIGKIIAEKYGENRSKMQIGRWIRSAALRIAQNDNLMDYDVKMVKGMSELNELQSRIERMLDEKVVKYEYDYVTVTKGGKGTMKRKRIAYKEISPMALVGLTNTLVIVLDKKNQIRGLNNNTIQLQLHQSHNSYNNTITIGDEFKHLDPDVQKQLRDIFEESEQLADIDKATAIDGEGRIIDESDGVQQEREEQL